MLRGNRPPAFLSNMTYPYCTTCWCDCYGNTRECLCWFLIGYYNNQKLFNCINKDLPNTARVRLTGERDVCDSTRKIPYWWRDLLSILWLVVICMRKLISKQQPIRDTTPISVELCYGMSLSWNKLTGERETSVLKGRSPSTSLSGLSGRCLLLSTGFHSMKPQGVHVSLLLWMGC